jgi:hypothetical protein
VGEKNLLAEFLIVKNLLVQKQTTGLEAQAFQPRRKPLTSTPL